jgi:hypothetical protein
MWYPGTTPSGRSRSSGRNGRSPSRRGRPKPMCTRRLCSSSARSSTARTSETSARRPVHCQDHRASCRRTRDRRRRRRPMVRLRLRCRAKGRRKFGPRRADRWWVGQAEPGAAAKPARRLAVALAGTAVALAGKAVALAGKAVALAGKAVALARTSVALARTSAGLVVAVAAPAVALATVFAPVATVFAPVATVFAPWETRSSGLVGTTAALGGTVPRPERRTAALVGAGQPVPGRGPASAAAGRV